MPRALIVVESIEQAVKQSPVLQALLAALEIGHTKDKLQVTSVEVVAANSLEFDLPLQEIILCPLTLSLPGKLIFPHQRVFQICQDVTGLRQHLAQTMQVESGDGRFWLPVIFTAKGPLYGEAIALKEELIGTNSPNDVSLFELSYYQPFHLSDTFRQPLYHMAYRLLTSLSAPPATYLVQFGLQADKIFFDRLWPFPTAPALASINVQQPDLFTCHWYCLAAKPLLDLAIVSFAN